jgi:probable rRNA maturation factor
VSRITIQVASSDKNTPSSTQIRKWAKHVLVNQNAEDRELSIRVVDEAESHSLNHSYRHKDKPTNVLSFPMDAPPGVALPILGDIVLCAQVINAEAKAQGKTQQAHWAHMVTHGILHLLGFDHIEEQDAMLMEQREIELLQELGFANPYGEK